MTYTLYGGQLSLFTRKLEAALKFTGLPFDFFAKNSNNREHLELRAGKPTPFSINGNSRRYSTPTEPAEIGHATRVGPGFGPMV